jgi:hypothetical protein
MLAGWQPRNHQPIGDAVIGLVDWVFNRCRVRDFRRRGLKTNWFRPRMGHKV